MKTYKPELSNIHEGAIIADTCTVHSHVWIGDNVTIGERCKIQAFAFIPPGVTIGDDCFIGPRVTFTNDKYPPSGGRGWLTTRVCDGVSIGAGAIIMPGIELGEGCKIAAGSVVTVSVPPRITVMGVPARPKR